MITAEDCEAIERGKKHCYVVSNGTTGFRFECAKCKEEYKMQEPCPVWVMECLAWGFCKEHADYEVGE